MVHTTNFYRVYYPDFETYDTKKYQQLGSAALACERMKTTGHIYECFVDATGSVYDHNLVRVVDIEA